MAPAAAVTGADETSCVVGEVARVLDESCTSLAVHPRKLRELAALRSSSGGRFLPAFCAALTPLFDLLRRSAASDRAARFAAAFTSASAAGEEQSEIDVAGGFYVLFGSGLALSFILAIYVLQSSQEKLARFVREAVADSSLPEGGVAKVE